MKKISLFVVTLAFIASSLTAQNQSMDSLSYSVGVLIAQNLKQQGLTEVKTADVASGIADALSGDLKMDMQKVNQTFQSHMQALQAKQFEGIIKEGADFLAQNGKRPEVTTLASGLQYEILKEGTGPKPSATDKVTTHYHGTLINGKVFDSSVQRGQPATFPVNGVIQGWVEALQLMPVGSKWKLFVPYNLAYGERGAGQDIKPYSTLVFEVELLEIL